MEQTINQFEYEISPKRKTKIVNGELYLFCTKCRNYYPIDHFELRWNHAHTEKNKVRSHCKKCRTEESRIYHFTRRRRYSEEFAKEKIIHIDRMKHDFDYHNRTILLRQAKQHAKKIGVECTITIDDITVPNKCPILETNFILHDKYYTYSIDRIDNTKGYIPGNIGVITRLANMMKNCASEKQLLLFSKNIKSYIKK